MSKKHSARALHYITLQSARNYLTRRVRGCQQKTTDFFAAGYSP